MAKAQTETKSAALSSEFGLQYATRLFGQEAIESLPRLKTEPNKGKVKGFIIWMKTTSPGYCVYIGGGATAGMVVRAWIADGPLATQSMAVSGKWMGRLQTLCGSRATLGEENRKRWMSYQ